MRKPEKNQKKQPFHSENQWKTEKPWKPYHILYFSILLPPPPRPSVTRLLRFGAQAVGKAEAGGAGRPWDPSSVTWKTPGNQPEDVKKPCR